MVSTQDDELNQLREQRRLALQKQLEQQAASQAMLKLKHKRLSEFRKILMLL